MTFHLLGLSDALLDAVEALGYAEPTPIQTQAIPAVLQGRDVLGVAQTGTGKTAAFVLPIIDILSEGRARARMPRCLIIEPTRELAAQVSEGFDRYGKNHKLSMALLIGGVAFGDQDRALERGVDVLIATPGRLIDQIERSKILLSGVEMLVIDEADRMLDMGFIPDIERICRLIPAKRQTLLFSATMPTPIKRLADQFMREPKTIEVSRPATANSSIEQRLFRVAPRGKRELLRSLLRSEAVQNAIIFCNRKRDVSTLHDSLRQNGFQVGQLHGDMDQSERLAVLEQFRAGTLPILVASDVAARGLDIPGVSHVFNFDVPIHAEDYIHRIGRTGRAGRTGIAITLATDAEMEAVEAIERLARAPIPRAGEAAETDEGLEPKEAAAEPDRAPARSATGRSRRRRGGDSARPPAPETEQAVAEERADRPAHDTPAARPGRRQEPERGKSGRDRRGGYDRPTGRGGHGGREDELPEDGWGRELPAFLRVSARAEMNDEPVGE